MEPIIHEMQVVRLQLRRNLLRGKGSLQFFSNSLFERMASKARLCVVEVKGTKQIVAPTFQ